MARQSATFSGMPQNLAVRRRIYQRARTGKRPKPHTPNMGDALKTITAASRYVEAFNREKETIEFLQVLEDSWKARKDWR